MSFDAFDTQIQVEECTDYLNSLSKDEMEFFECDKCGELITDLERQINDDNCPCCSSPLPFGIFVDEEVQQIDGDDIPF